MVSFSRDWEDRSGSEKDVAFNRHSINEKTGWRHNSPFDSGGIDIGTDDIVVRLSQGIDEENLQRVLSRSLAATTGFDPSNPPTDLPWEEMFKGGLQSALESQVVVFEVARVSRAQTHQTVRTRRAAFHQQSQRATFMGEAPDVRMPESIWKNDRARIAFVEAVEKARDAYAIACEEDIAYQDARYILPEGSETFIQCEYPLKEFIATYAYRGCQLFLWETVYVFHEMKRVLVEAHPWIEPYVKVTCEKTHVCEFQGWEQVEGQCNLPWAREDNRRYRPPKSLTIVSGD